MHGDWYWYMSGASALIAGVLVVSGVVAVSTGRVLPWQRRQILRPELWGYSSMLVGTGLLLMTWESSDTFDGTPPLDGAVWFTGLLLMIAGGWFQELSTRQPLDA
ncbi:hypothetical protein [Streptomyces sp. NBC_00576]|uniref:hypothetical protein n=1 Tax=Streptomyces sp. NBC_00576 TaxID=2903665 RepID=UPI002E81555B|nr:hypothetical protein [Streptomyces sp. NBC_00576]WUB71311.1 hypothetical protein OG734_15065 [Streptomyces sp. NBC_00576]